MNLGTIVVLIFTIIFFVLIYLLIDKKKEWEEFKLEHNCKIVARISGSTGISTSGQAVSIPSKTGWLCDDGITYYR